MDYRILTFFASFLLATIPQVHGQTTAGNVTTTSSNMTAAPSNMTAPSSNMTAAPSSSMTAAPSSNMTAAPSSNMTAAPSSNMTVAPSSNMTVATASTETLAPNTTAVIDTTATTTTTTTTTSAAPIVTVSADSLTAFDLVFSSSESFIADLSNSSSSAFNERVQTTRNQIEPVYDSLTSFIQLVVTGFTNGSIVTSGQVQFNSSGTDVPEATAVANTLRNAVNNGQISIPIQVNSIGVTPVNTTTTTTPITTTTTTTATTTSMAPVFRSLGIAAVLFSLCGTMLFS